MLAGIGAGTRKDVRQFAGCYLTEPKAHVTFEPPPRPLAPAAFARRVARDGLHLAPATRLLLSAGTAFINGEAHAIAIGGSHRALLLRLADRRALAPCTLPPAVAQPLHAWYCAGYVACGHG
jgi:50S ribosomal protein L16 3-hydroxylase